MIHDTPRRDAAADGPGIKGRHLEIESHTDFDYGALEPEPISPTDEASEKAATALKLTLEWLWESHLAGDAALEHRLAAMLICLRTQQKDLGTFADAARALRCTRAALSKIAVEFCSVFRVHLNQHSDSTRHLKALQGMHAAQPL